MPVEIGLCRFGVKRRTVVEFDAGPQFERPGLEIIRMIPGNRKLGLWHALVIKISKRVEKRRSRCQRRGIKDADLQRIETGNIELKADSDAAAGLLGLRGAFEQVKTKCRRKENSRERTRMA